MYGDTAAIRRRSGQLREQGEEIRATADRLVAQTEAIAWTGRAADAMRERIRERAGDLRSVAAGHDGAADSLDQHGQEVDRLKEAIAERARATAALMADDDTLADFTLPPPGHRDWLTIELRGL